jgi:ribose transport system substrate-binding protein
LIDATWNQDAGAMTAKKCKEKDVVLISCDCIFAEDTHMIGADNYESGVIIGTYMADYVKKVWNGEVDYLVIINEDAAGETTLLRMNGSIDALKDKDIAVTDENTSWFDSGGQMLKAKSAVTDFLTAHPDGKKILIGCLNDESGLGALAGVQSSGREADCLIYSYGGEPSSAENFKKEENCWVATVNFNLPKYGDLAMDTIADLLAGKTRPLTQSPELNVIDRSNVLEYYPD